MAQTIFVALLVVAFVQAAAAADANRGKTIAQRWCASCHVISHEQKQGTTHAPPFSEVAGRPNFNAARLALFLMSPHPVMPDMNLTRDEAADLAAYIETQK